MSKKHEPHTFCATATLPDGREVWVSLSVPPRHPAVQGRWAEENAEIAQLAAASVLRNWRKGDESREDVPF